MADRIPYGLRRYPLAAVIFGGLGAGLLTWSSYISERTFVFPLGVVEPENARLVIGGVGVAALIYLLVLTHARFVRRPFILLGKTKIELPIGEFGARRLILHKGDVRGLDEGKTPGGWRYIRISHDGGTHTLSSAQLPDDASLDRVRDRLHSFLNPP